MCVRGIDVFTYEFLLFDLWYCCDSVVFFVFHFINNFSTWCIGRAMYCPTLSTSSSFICGNQNILLQSTCLTTPFESLFTWCISLKYCSTNVKQQSINQFALCLYHSCFLFWLFLYLKCVWPYVYCVDNMCTVKMFYICLISGLWLADLFW